MVARLRRRLWTTGIVVLASLITLMGVMVGAFRIAVQLVPGYKAELEQRIGDAINSPVRIGLMDLRMRGLQPTVRFEDVAVGLADVGRLELDSLQIGFTLPRLIGGDLSPERVVLEGPALRVTYGEDGIQVSGINPGPGAATDGDPREQLRRVLDVTDIEVRDARVVWEDQVHGLPAREFHNVRLKLLRREGRCTIDISGRPLERPDAEVEARLAVDPDGWTVQRVDGRMQGLELWQELEAWAPGLPRLDGRVTELEFESEWQDGRWRTISGVVGIEALTNASRSATLRRLGSGVHVERRDNGLRVFLDDLRVDGARGDWPSGSVIVDVRRGVDGGTRLAVDADFLRLEDVVPFVADAVRDKWPQLAAVNPRGDISQLIAHWQTGAGWPSVTATLKRVGWSHHERLPGVDGLSGALHLEGHQGRLQLLSENLSVVAPAELDQPLIVEHISGQVTWQQSEAGWQVTSDGLDYEALGLSGVGRLVLDLGAEPRIAADLDFFAPEPVRWLAYQPRFWSPQLRQWLNNAVQAAIVERGHIAINGVLGPQLMDEGEDGFTVALDIRDATFAYAAGWPPLEEVTGRLTIAGRRLSVEADGGRVGATRIRQAKAVIDSLEDSVIRVEADLQGDAGDMLALVSDSPLRDRVQAVREAIDASGPATVHASLQLPIRAMDQLRYRADAQLHDVTIRTPLLAVPVTRVAGQLVVDNDGVRGSGFRGEVSGMPLLAELRSGAATGHVQLHSTIDIDPSKLDERLPVPRWIASRALGASEWLFDLDVSRGHGVELSLRSSLKGTAVTLPKPFAKPADAARSLLVKLSPEERGGTRLRISYGNTFSYSGLLGPGGAPVNSHVRIGGEIAPDSRTPGLWLEGRMDSVDWAEWWPVLSDAGQSGGDGRFGGAVMTLGEVHALGQTFSNTRLQVTRDDGLWRARLSGPDLLGQIAWPRESTTLRPTLQVDFDRLNWQWDRAEPADSDGGIGDFDPRLSPGIDLAVKNLVLNGQSLGRLGGHVEPLEDGLSAPRLVLGDPARPDLELSGSWQIADDDTRRAQLDFKGDTGHLRSWLRALGYQDSLDARRARLSGQIEWPPQPERLTLAGARAHFEFDFRKGQFASVDPGAGRVLGLLSINALPRRFTLDFADVAEDGFGYDRFSGSFDMSDGVAVTRDLSVDSPSLRVEAAGSIGVIDRTYDQMISIYPGVSSGVTLAAAVLGGPAMGVLALLAQEILDKPLDQVTQLSYHLGGTWDDPQVTKPQ